jgi:ABC-2 type transport system permease protein
MRLALTAEWVKLRTAPGAFLAVGLALVLTVGLSVAAAALGGGPDQVRVSLLGVQLGQAVVAMAAVRVLAGEYGSGLIRATFAALPRRLPVLAAKASFVLAGTVAAAAPAVLISVLAGSVLAPVYPALSSGAVVRAAAGSVLYLMAVALLGLGVAAAVRSAAAAAGIVLGLLYLAPAVVNLFIDPDMQRALYRLAPSTAGLSVQATVDLDTLPIGPWAGLGVAAAWAFTACAVGGTLLCRRDV